MPEKSNYERIQNYHDRIEEALTDIYHIANDLAEEVEVHKETIKKLIRPIKTLES